MPSQSREIGHGFRGDASFVYALEGSGLAIYGRSAYWPGGASGVTLDPGFDLGQHRDAAPLCDYYEEILTGAQMAACLGALGVQGKAAAHLVGQSERLRSIRIAPAEAARLFPIVARPYWRRIVGRFPPLTSDITPPAVQTVFLSLAYNRGAGNDGLDALRVPLEQLDWPALADTIDAMQEDHPVEGVTKRRDLEAGYVREHVREYARDQKERMLAQALRKVTPASLHVREALDLAGIYDAFPWLDRDFSSGPNEGGRP